MAQNNCFQAWNQLAYNFLALPLRVPFKFNYKHMLITSLIMGGEFTFLFWVLAVGAGILFPFAIGLYELIPHFTKGVELREYNPWVTGVVTTSVLLGGFMLRYVVIYAGQMAQFTSS